MNVLYKKNIIAVFLCLTSYHVYVSYAYAKYLYEKYNIKSRFLLYGIPGIYNVKTTYLETIYLEKKEDHLVDLIKKRIVYAGYFFRFSKIKNIIKKNEATFLFVFNDLNPVVYKIMRLTKQYNYNSPICIVDEGLAIYTDTKTDLKLGANFYLREFILRFVFGSPSHYKSIGDDERVNYVIVGDPLTYKELVKSFGKVVLKQNKQDLFCADYIIDYVDKFFHQKLEKMTYFAVFIGQNYSGKGYITEQEQILLDEIGIILKRFGNVLIKPHPTDNENKYDSVIEKSNNYFVLDSKLSKIPMECLFAFLNCKYIFTFNSSAALNIALCFHEKIVVFLVDYKLTESNRIPIRECLAGSNPLHSLQFDKALKRLNNVYTPKNKAELISILNKQNERCFEEAYYGFDISFKEIDRIIQDNIY